MNKMEELEFLTKLQDLSIGISSYNDIEVGCELFTVVEKENKLGAQITIDMKRVNWKKKMNKYLESLLRSNEIEREIRAIIVIKIRDALEKRKMNIREEIKEMLGVSKSGVTIPNRE